MGAIQDRTNEHLGTSDKAIVQYRRLLRQEIEKVVGGEKPMHVPRRRACAQHPGPGDDGRHRADAGWEIYWMEVDVKRRRGAPWAAPVPSEIAGKIRHLSAAE